MWAFDVINKLPDGWIDAVDGQMFVWTKVDINNIKVFLMTILGYRVHVYLFNVPS